MSDGEGMVPRVVTSLARALLALYPRSFREDVGPAVIRDVRHRASSLCRDHGAMAAVLWLPRLSLSLVTNAIGAWLDRLGSGRGLHPKGHRRLSTLHIGTPENTMETFLQDVRFALRGLWRNPGFTSVALLTLALGIGANAAVFSVVHGVVLRPLPYRDAGELALLYQVNTRSGDTLGRVSYEDLQDWQSRARSLESIAAFVSAPTILAGEEEPLEIEMTYVTSEFFDVLGVRAELGRVLQADDHRLAQRNAVISRELWRTTLGADPDVIGRSLRVRDSAYTVVGVMPSSMRHPTPETDMWVPQSLVQPNMFSNGPPTRGDRYLQAFGRLAPGVDAPTAQRELTGVSSQLAAAHPDTNVDWNAATVVALHEAIVGDVDRALMIVLALVALVLLIACANLANLLLARGAVRQRELAVRITLGAARRRVMRQLLTESLVLAVLGGLLGLGLSWWGVKSILALSAETLPRVQEVHVDAQVVGFTLAITVLTGLVFGLVPALRMAHLDPQRHLRGRRGAGPDDGRRLRSALVVAEVALAVLLLVGTGLMSRSFMVLRSVDPGFEPQGVLTVTMQLNLTGVPEEELADFLVQRREEILQRVRGLPGVESAGMINVFPLHGGAFSLEYTRADGKEDPEEIGVHADTRYVDPGYVQTMHIPLLRGEPLPDRLERGEIVPVLMSESAARHLWPNDDAVGRRINVPWGQSVVVGVVGDVRQIGLAQGAQPAVYFPQLIAPRLMATLVVRTLGDPASLAAPIRQLIKDIDPNQPIRAMQPLADLMAESIARERFFTVLFAVFGGLALALSAVGVYGVLAYTVRQRTREIGIRIALGAGGGDVLRMVTGGGMKLVGLGVVVGTIAALGLSRVLGSQLYGVAPTDPLAFAFAIVFLGVMALVASYVPALRAMRLPPQTALRE